NPRAVMGEKSKMKPATPRNGPESGEGTGPGEKSGEKKGKRGKGGDSFRDGPEDGPPGMKGPNAMKGPGGMSAEDMQKRQQEFQEKFKKATPAERKAMLQQIPEAYREKARENMKAQGFEIAS